MAKKTNSKEQRDTGRPLRLEWIAPADLAGHPGNWRRHPESQRAALEAALSEIGWVGACLFNERTGRLVDGHARRDIAVQKGIPAVPVLVGSWDESQEAKILATFDPLGDLAEADPVKLESLLQEIEVQSADLAKMLDEFRPPPSLDVGDAPASVLENVEAMESVKKQRRKGNAEKAEKSDTERYLVLVYRNRQLKESALQMLGLPVDERYVAADSVVLKARYQAKPAQENGRSMKAASAKHSGATG